jgi:putative cell wall-binding protein
MLKLIRKFFLYKRIEKLTAQEITLQKHMNNTLEKIDHLFHDPGNSDLLEPRSFMKRLNKTFATETNLDEKLSKAKAKLLRFSAATPKKEELIEANWADVHRTMNEILGLQKKKKELYFKLR